MKFSTDIIQRTKQESEREGDIRDGGENPAIKRDQAAKNLEGFMGIKVLSLWDRGGVRAKCRRRKSGEQRCPTTNCVIDI